MPIKPDLVNLLPSTKTSVKDLIAITKRAKPFGTVQIVIESDDVALREKAGAALSARLAKLESTRPELITDFAPDDAPLNHYAWTNRFLLAPYDDLVAARDGLKARIDKARLQATGLYIDVDDDDDDPDANKLADVETKLEDLEAKDAKPPPRISADGKLQLLVVSGLPAMSLIAFVPPVRETVNRLEEHHREAIACRYFLDLSEEETAAVLGCRRGTVKSRLARALERLRAELGEEA